MQAIKNAVVVLLDSLNRHLVGCYGGREFDTPNLDRLAARGVRFTRHYSGSLPCMPARHDLLCGALDFLWKPWGSIELWERPITVLSARAGVVTKLDQRPPAPVRARRRELPRRFLRLGLPARSRVRSMADDRRRDDWIGTPRYHRPQDYPYHRQPSRCSARRPTFPGPQDDGGRGALARARTRALTSASCCSSTSSIRTSRSIRPSRTRRCYDPSWTGPQTASGRPTLTCVRRRRARRRARSARSTAASSR